MQPQLARETAVMRKNSILAQAFAKVVCDALRQPARIHKHERRFVFPNQRGHTVVDLLPHLV